MALENDRVVSMKNLSDRNQKFKYYANVYRGDLTAIKSVLGGPDYLRGKGLDGALSFGSVDCFKTIDTK